ncbi:MAG: ZIP family metal transporter [Candidatus Taylorbacteria bacterium]
MIILISFATFVFTLLGGLFALRLKDKLHLILGFSAGAVIAVAFFDLIPEALELGETFFENGTILAITALGFLSYLVLDRLVFIHAHAHDEGDENGHKAHTHRGILGAGSLCIHSFLDGVAIGLAFQVSTAVGAIVAVAVLTHDFSDGVNTVNLILKNKGEGRHAFRWLIADAVAPVLGAVSTLFFAVPEQGLSIILALFAGFFLYIGASDLIPESHHAHPKFLTTALTIAGAGVLYVAIHFAGV